MLKGSWEVFESAAGSELFSQLICPDAQLHRGCSPKYCMSKLGQGVLGGGYINASLDELLHDLCCMQENHHRELVRVFHLALGINLLVEVNLLNGGLLAILACLLRGLRRRRAFPLVG
jgi:hypothetical protein